MAGLVTALVQAAIGVPAGAIVDDYARSHEPAARRRAWVVADPLDDDPKTAYVPEFLFSAPADAMRLLLDRMVDRYGSLAAWVASFPVRPNTVNGLRDALIA